MWTSDKHVRQKEVDIILSDIVDKFVDITFNDQHAHVSHTNEDKVLVYGKQLLSIGCLYLEFADAVKEGDGDRLIRCWRCLLIIFCNSNRKNYAKEAILLLYQFGYVLSPQQTEQLLYNRFINMNGVPGRNILSDLYMEHLNRQLKNSIGALGSRKTENSIIRCGKAIGTIAPVLEQFDKINNVTEHHTLHKATEMKKDLVRIVNHMNKCKIFTMTEGRRYPTFPNPRCLLHKQTENELISWTKMNMLYLIISTIIIILG